MQERVFRTYFLVSLSKGEQGVGVGVEGRGTCEGRYYVATYGTLETKAYSFFGSDILPGARRTAWFYHQQRLLVLLLLCHVPGAHNKDASVGLMSNDARPSYEYVSRSTSTTRACFTSDITHQAVQAHSSLPTNSVVPSYEYFMAKSTAKAPHLITTYNAQNVHPQSIKSCIALRE